MNRQHVVWVESMRVARKTFDVFGPCEMIRSTLKQVFFAGFDRSVMLTSHSDA